MKRFSVYFHIISLLIVVQAASAQDLPSFSKKSAPASVAAASRNATANSVGRCQVSPLSLYKTDDSSYNVDCGPNLDAEIFRGDGPIIINFPVSRAVGDVAALKTGGLISPTLTINIAAFDIDSEANTGGRIAPEHDRVIFNGHVVGLLHGIDNQWLTNTFEVPIEWVRFPTSDGVNPVVPVNNQLQVDIDVDNVMSAWRAEVDWASIHFTVARPVLLVHGILSSSDTWEKPLYSLFPPSNYFLGPGWRQKLETDGFLVGAVSLPGFGQESIDTNAVAIGLATQRLRLATGADKIDIQAHSKGGIDSRHYVENHDDVERLIMLGTPNEGSPLADYILKFTKRIKRLQRLIDHVLPIERLLTRPYMRDYNRMHGYNSKVGYSIIAGVYHPGYSFTLRNLGFHLLNQIVGKGDLAVPKSSAFSLPYTERLRIDTSDRDQSAVHWHQTGSIFFYSEARSRLLRPFLPSVSASKLGLGSATVQPIPTITDDDGEPDPIPPDWTSATLSTIALGETHLEKVAIDESVPVTFSLLYPDGDLRFILVSPSGIRYMPDSTFIAGDGYDVADMAGAPMKLYHFERPETGVWTAEITGTGITDSAGGEYVLQAGLQSPSLKLDTALEKTGIHVNDSFRVLATLTRGSLPVVGASVVAEVAAPSGAVEQVPLYDDGTHGDIVPSDGVYTTLYGSTSHPGGYDLTVSASETRVGAIPFSRETSLRGTVTSSSSTMTGPYSDAAYDTDGDRGLDEIQVSAMLNADIPSHFSIYGELKNADGVTVSTAALPIDIPSAMPYPVKLHFPGGVIYSSHSNGPFHLTLRLAQDANDSIMVIQELNDVYTTQTYDWSSFQPPPPDALAQTQVNTPGGSGIYGGQATASATLSAYGSPVAGKVIAFTVQATALGTAITDANGLATLTAPTPQYYPGGAYPITASFAGDPVYNQSSDMRVFYVNKGTQVISWSNPANIEPNSPLGPAQLNALVSASGTAPVGKLTYTPPTGTLLPPGDGQILKVEAAENTFYYAAAKSVQINVRKAAPQINWSNPADVVYGTPLGASELNSTTSIAGTFTYTPPAGTILDAGATQTLQVTFTPSDPSVPPATATVHINVLKAKQTITWAPPAAVTYGTPLSPAQLNATVSVVGTAPAGVLTYAPTPGAILHAGVQMLTVSAAATLDYEATAASVPLTVLKATPVLTWATPASIVYGTPLSSAQLNATSNVDGTFTYSPAAGTVLHAGSQTLTASLVPANVQDYEGATASVSLTVAKATPLLTWSAPVGIVYGTPLSPAQLNATSNVDGAFAFTPPSGAILDAGSQTLTASFTPAGADYENASATVQLPIAKAKQTIAWTTPASIVYGTRLGATQLNATVSVVGPAPAGTLTYAPPIAAMLDSGTQTLTVNAAETNNYEPATANATLSITRAKISLVVSNQSKFYGAALPPLTGSLTGIVPSDAITPRYATTATDRSVVGTYPITALLGDPNGRLGNYDVSITPGTLTIAPASLVVTADARKKQYSDPLPPFTATMQGFVLGETPLVLAGTFALQTTATPSSAPGVYPITAGGVSSSNYAITFGGGTLTVTAEDARIAFLSPITAVVSPAGATSGAVTLAATVLDISATPEANGDTAPGDVRHATLTFVDRATNAVLCTAPVGLVDASDARTGTATCTFTAPVGTSTIGIRVGGYYTRDAAADDVTLTVALPTSDFLTGGGFVTLSNTAGAYAAAPNSPADFVSNVKYDKRGLTQGAMALTFTRTENGTKHRYEIAAAQPTLLISRSTVGGTAYVAGTASVTDVTNAISPLVVETGATLVATFTDNGEPSTNDTVAFTLLNRVGGLLFSSKWSGTATAPQALTGGNLEVHQVK